MCDLSKALQKRQNKRTWAIFCNFHNIDRSTNQQTIQLDIFHQDMKLATSFEILLTDQGTIFSKQTPKIGLK